jgi:RNA polymerase sigma factor (sigma-70 family)
MIKKYQSVLNNFGISKDELDEEKIFVVYKSALNFNPDKNVKFSTWLGNQMRYYCLNLINKNHSGISMDDENIKYILEKNQIALSENFDKEKIELILDILNQMKDKRMSKIFKLRYFNKTNKVLSWNAIGKRLKISTQTAINIHNKALKLINTKLNSQNCFDKI